MRGRGKQERANAARTLLLAALVSALLLTAATAGHATGNLQVHITSEPRSVSSSADASFAFVANETATFSCALDGGRPTSCTSPKRYERLENGLHDFTVTARNTDRSGHVYTARAQYRWTVDLASAPPVPPAPPPPLTPPPPESPVDRERIVFVSNEPDPEIWTMNAGGTGALQLTRNIVPDTDPAWSPDGKSIAFASGRDGDFEIFVMKANGTSQIQLTHNKASDVGPTWSPDGKWIAFASDRDGDSEIFAMKANGTNQLQLTANATDDGDPDWSPNGAKIAFSERFGRGGDGEIKTMKADGTGSAVLTANDAEDTQPAWSPDSKKIAFTSDRDGNPEVFVMNADGSGEKQLTSGGSVDRDSTWLSSVPAIGFSSDRGGAPEIFTMTAAGGGQALLTDVLSNARLPDWHWNPLLDALPDVPASLGPQRAGGVTVFPRGHFVAVYFHELYTADKPRVELWQGSSLKGFQTGSGPAKTSWNLQVDHLKPHQAYTLWIVMKDPIHGGWQYQKWGTVKTLRRDVTVIYDSVHVIYDGDDGISGCGEFVFRLHAGRIGNAIEQWTDEQDICSGYSWEKQWIFHFHNVRVPQMSVWVFGTDEDDVGWDVNLTDEKVFSVEPVDYTVEGEQFSKSFTVSALSPLYSSSSPKFKYYGHYDVFYVKW